MRRQDLLGKREVGLERKVLALFKTLAVFQDERTLERGHRVIGRDKLTIYRGPVGQGKARGV